MSTIDGITYVSVERTEYVLSCALLATNYQPGDSFSFSFTMEDIAYISDSYPLLQLAENYYLIAQANNYLGLSYQKGHMMEDDTFTTEGRSLWEASALVDGVNEYETGEGQYLYSWISRNSSGNATPTQIAKTVVTVGTDGVDSVIEIACQDGRRSRVTLRGVVLNLKDFSFPEESEDEETGRAHGRIENVSGTVILNGVEYSLFTNEFAMQWAGTEENHIWNTDEENTIWQSEADGAVAYMPGDEVFFDASGHRVVTIQSDVQARIVGVMADITFEVQGIDVLSVSEMLRVMEGVTLTLTANGTVACDCAFTGDGSVLLASGTWQLTRQSANLGGITVAEGSTLVMGEGIVYDNYGTDVVVQGTIVSRNNEVADAVAGRGSVVLGASGQLILENGRIVNKQLVLESGAVLSMSGGALDTIDNVVRNAGTISLAGVEIRDSIVNSGALSLEGCVLDANSLTVSESASLRMVDSSGRLDILNIDARAEVTLTGNDFSTTRVSLSNLSPESSIDLSGNYWGENVTKEEIIARIQGYDAAYVTLDSWILSAPDADFVAHRLLGKTLLSAESDSITVKFSHAIDESSIEGNIHLQNQQGDVIELLGYTQVNGELFLSFAPLPADGEYFVVLGGGLKNEYGKSLRVEEGTGTLSLGFQADVTPETVQEVRVTNAAVTGAVVLALSGPISEESLAGQAWQLAGPDGEAVQVLSVELLGDGNTIRVYVGAFPAVGEYKLTLPPGLADAAGNKMNAGEVAFSISRSDIAGEYTVVVNNLNASGIGSFHAAVEQINENDSEVPMTIMVDEAFAGMNLELPSTLSCSKPCVVEGNGLILTNKGLSFASEAALKDLTLPQIALSGAGYFVAENVTLTAQQAASLSDWSGFASFEGVSVTADGAYVGISGTFGNTTLSALPLSFAGGYKMTGSVTVKSGATVTLAEGVCIGRTGSSQYLYINGTLEARNKEVADALTATQNWTSTYVKNGGKLLLENANLNLGGWDSYLDVQDGGTLEMSGGSLYSWGGLRTRSNGAASLVGVEVKSSVSNEGSTELEGTTHTAAITNSGTLAMQGVASTSYVQNTGSLTARNVTLGGYLDSRGTANLENVSCATLYVDSVGDVVTTGTGVTMTSDEVFRLYDFSGGVDELLDSMVWTATSVGDRYIGLYGSFGDTTLSALPLSFAGGYKMTGSVTVKSGATVTLAEGVCIGRTGSSQYLYINGTLEARNKEVADALTATQNWTSTYVKNGGKLLLENANLNLGGWDSYLDVQDGGTLEMSGGSLYSWGGLRTRSNGAASLVGVEVKSSVSNEGSTELEGTTHTAGITNSGTLAMQGVTSTSYVQNTGSLTARNVTLEGYLDSRGTANLENVSCATLYVDSIGDVTTEGAGVTMTGAEVFRLYNFSGNVDELFDSITWKSTSEEDKYISIYGNLGDVTLSALSDNFAGGYKLAGGARVNTGATLVLEEGVSVQLSSQNFYIYGNIEAQREFVSDAFVSDASYVYFHLHDGAQVRLKNANIKLTGYYSDIDVNEDCLFESVGGEIVLHRDIEVYAGGTLKLTDVEVSAVINNGGTTKLADTTHTAGITNSGTLEMQGVTSTSYVQNTGSLTARNVTLEGYLDSRGTANLENVSCATLYVDSIGDVTTEGAGVTMTGAEVFRLYNFSGNVDELFDSITWKSTSEEDKYISIYGNLGDVTLSALPDNFAGGYKLAGGARVNTGATLVLEEGVSVQLSSQNFYIYGNIEAEREFVSDAFVSDASYVYFHLHDGAQVRLKNANIKLTGYNSDIDVNEDCLFESVGGEIVLHRDIEVYARGTLKLTDVEVSAVINNGGTTKLADTTHTAGITNSGTLEMQGVTSTSYVQNTGSLTARNVTLGGYLDSRGTANLENVSCATLYVDSIGDVTTEGAGVTMSGAEVFRLYNFSGNVDELFDSITWKSTSEEDKYISIYGNLGDVTLSALPDNFAGGYKLAGGARVNGGATLVLEEGVSVQMSSQNFYIYGNIEVEREVVSDAFVSDASYVYFHLHDGAQVRLKNANIKLTGYNSDIDVNEDCLFESEGGEVVLYHDIEVYAGGTLRLTGTEVSAVINNRGTSDLTACDIRSAVNNNCVLNMVSCRMNNQHVMLNSGSTSTIINTAGIGRLTINSGCNVTIQGNDFSGTTIVLNNIPEGEIIDLSGNYWGTSDLEVIKSRIQGYDETRVLIATLLSEPNAQVFSFDASMLGAHRISDKAGSLVLRFNAMVDADTVSAETIRLVDEQGNALPIAGFEVAGNEVTLVLESLPQGVYSVQVGAGLLDVVGNAFSEPAGQRKVNFLSMELDAPKVIFFRSNSTVTDQFRYVDFFFDQDMEAATVTAENIHIYTESGVEVNINRILQSGIQGNVFFRAYFDEVTEPGTYRIVVDSAVQTTDGRNMATDYVKEVYVASPDLEVPGLVEYTDDHLGRYTTITYNVLNSGDGEARGTWTDHIYLCKSETWDESQAVFFASVERRNQIIAPGESYSASARALLDSLEPGEYYVFVKSDMASRVSEGNEINNISATGTSIVLSVDSHELGNSSHVMNSANELLYLAYTATEDASMCFTVEGVNTRIFVSESRPTAANTVASVFREDEASRAYFAVEVGKTYYIGLSPRMRGSIKTSIDEVEFAIVGSSISFVSPGCDCSLTMTGAEFTDGMRVWLRDVNGNILEAVKVEVLDSCTAKVMFAVPDGIAPGDQYTLVAQREGGIEASLETPLDVVGITDAIEYEVVTGTSFRVGAVCVGSLTTRNLAGFDVEAPIVMVLNTYGDDFHLYYGSEEVDHMHRSALVYLMSGADEDVNMLGAGEADERRVLFKKETAGSGYTPVKLLLTTDATQLTTDDWADISSAMRPVQVSEAEWNQWWNIIKPRIGDSMGDVARFIRQMQRANYEATGNNKTTLPDLVLSVMENCADFVPSRALSGKLFNANGEERSGALVKLYGYENGERVLLQECCTDWYGNFAFYRLEGNREYELELPETITYADENVNVLSVTEDELDTNLFLYETGQEVLPEERMLRLASDNQGNVYKAISKEGELYVELLGKTQKKYSLSLGRWHTMDDLILCWSEETQSLYVAWCTVEDSERKTYICAVRCTDSVLECDTPVRVFDGEVCGLTLDSDGSVCAVTLNDSDSGKTLVFNKLDSLSNYAEPEVNTSSGIVPDILEQGVKFEINWLDIFTISAEYEETYTRPSSSNGNVARGKVDVAMEVTRSWIGFRRKENKSKIKDEWRLKGTMDLEYEVAMAYDCDTQSIVTKERSFSGSVSLDVRNDMGGFQIIEKLSGVCTLSETIEKINEKLRRFNSTGEGGISLGVGGSFWYATDIAQQKDTKMKFGLGLSVYGTVDVEFGNNKTGAKLELDGEIQVKGGVEISQSGFGFTGSISGRVTAELTGYINFCGFERWYGGVSVGVEVIGSGQGVDVDFDFDLKLGKEKLKSSASPYVYSRKVEAIEAGRVMIDDAVNGSYAPSGALSAYVYVNETSGVFAQFVDATSGEVYGEAVSIIQDDPHSLLSGYANIEFIDAETDGAGNLYIAVSGFSSYSESLNFSLHSSFEELFGSRKFEMVSIDSSGNVRNYDDKALKTFSWQNKELDTTQNVINFDTYYLKERLGMVWVTETDGVYHMFAASMVDGTWCSPELLFSSVSSINECYIGDLNDDFYVSFTQDMTKGGTASALSYAFVFEEGKWKYDEKLNTENANEGYQSYLKACEPPAIEFEKPSIVEFGEDFAMVEFSWASTQVLRYILTVDGREYDLGAETAHTIKLENGWHQYKLSAVTSAGIEVETQTESYEVDIFAPMLKSFHQQYEINDEGVGICKILWNCSNAHSIQIKMGDVVHEVTGENEFSFALPESDTEYEFTAMSECGQITQYSGKIPAGVLIQTGMSTPEIISTSEGAAEVRFSWGNQQSGKIEVDGVLVDTSGTSSLTLNLKDGKHVYKLITEEGTVAEGQLVIDTEAPKIEYFNLQDISCNQGILTAHLVWSSNEFASYAVVVDGEVHEFGTQLHGTLQYAAGTREIILKAKDAHGNETQQRLVVTYDATAPELILSDPVTAMSENGAVVNFAWTAEDDSVCTYRVWVDQNLIYEGSENHYSWKATQGIASWSVEAVDSNGNVTRKDSNYEYSVPLSFKTYARNLDDESGNKTEISWDICHGATSYLVIVGDTAYEVFDDCSIVVTVPESGSNYMVLARKDGEVISTSKGNLPEKASADMETSRWWWENVDESLSFELSHTPTGTPGRSKVTISINPALLDQYEWINVLVNGKDIEPHFYKTIDITTYEVRRYSYVHIPAMQDGEYEIELKGTRINDNGTVETYYSKEVMELELDTCAPILTSFNMAQDDDGYLNLSWKYNEDVVAAVLTINGTQISMGQDTDYSIYLQRGENYNIQLRAYDKFGHGQLLVNENVERVTEREARDRESSITDFIPVLSRINSETAKLVTKISCPDGCPENPPPGQNCGGGGEGIIPVDPNDFYGPSGYGAKGWIAPQEMQFQVVCENIPEENIAHAAIVRITQQIDSAFDYSTFRLGDMMMGGNLIEVEGDVQSFRKRLDWTATHGVWVDVNAFFDADTGIVTWEFSAIDPETGYVVADPFKGLLAPNYNPPEGDGGVYYYVTPKSTVETGTEFGGQASIVFDFNEAILTPTLSYTLDKDAPVAQVKALAESSSSRFLRVEWSGEDVGSGVDYYNVFVSVDGGEWSLWQGGIAAASALYTVAEGEHTYAFFAQGVDYAGNAEALPELVAAEAATVSHYAPQGSSLRVTALAAGRDGDVLTLTVGFNEPASCTDWASALQLLVPAGALDMAAGSFRYDEATHTLTWVGSVAGVAAGEQLVVRLQDGAVSDAQGIALGDSRPAFSAAASLGAVGSAQAAPALVDYDGDGLLDLLVGEVASGKGRVRLYLNEGTAEVADFASFSYLTTAADTPLTVDAEGCQGAIVQLAELTSDAAAELVIGLADGTVRVFTVGEEGHWTDAGLLTCSVGGKEMTLDVGSRAAIEFVDFDGDGRTDLLVGEGDGHVVLYRDTAESGAASFDAGQYLHDSAGRIKVGSRASVVAADVDADGRVDLLFGSADGSILFYRNEGSAAEPLFATGVKLLSADKELDLSAETSRLRLDAADVNGDGLLDVVLGQSDGAVRVLYGADGASLLGVVQAGDNPLYAVENVQALAYGGQVRLSWDAVVGATYELSYKLAGDSSAQVLVLEDAVAVLPLADGRYELSVRALTPEGTGPWSAPLAVLVDTVAPLSPESLQASAGENGSVGFSWAEADSATAYELRYKAADSGSWQTLSCKATSVTLYNLPGGAYDWQVRAVDAAGNKSGWVSGAGFESTGAAAERVTWARGLSFDTTGKVTGGYYDIAKTGEGDSNLCWAAAAANILGWWQQQYPTGSALAGVPQDAAAIYACFCANWANKSGSESYAFTWWLADESDSASYMNYYYQNYQGSGELGGWYAGYYNVANIGNHTAQVKLSDMEAADVAGEWNGIYRSGGMLALGVYRSYSSGSFAGGHSLTLWGFQEDAQGCITQIHVTDSDDEQSSMLTLDVELDAENGLYRIAGEQGNVSGYYLGSYTYLKAGGMTPDGSSPEQAESLGMSSARDGSGHYSGSTLNWVGAGDAVDFFSITAAGDGAYRVGVDAATLETALRLSVGVLNGQGLFEVQQQMLLAPGAALAGLPGVKAGQGETLYVKVEALDTASAGTGGFYELNISGTVPAAGSGLATQDNSAEEAAESSADGSATRGWVGAGDACDFYRVEMAAAGSLSIGLDELEAAARVRIYEQRADGSLAQLDSRAVKAASGLDATLSLMSGTYFVEVASLDAGAGQFNTAYSLTLEKEEQQAADSGRNIMAQV